MRETNVAGVQKRCRERWMPAVLRQIDRPSSRGKRGIKSARAESFRGSNFAPLRAMMKAPTRILYVMDALHCGDVIGGTEGQVLQLLMHLDRRRFEPRLAVFRSSPYIERAERFPDRKS